MDNELIKETLDNLLKNQQYSNLHDIFKKLTFDNEHLVYGKYLYVFPPIPGVGVDIDAKAKNIFSMKYNELYNIKNNINPYAYSSESCESSGEN